MLAVVKMPHTDTEMVLNGDGSAEIIDFLRSRFSVQVLNPVESLPDDEDELIDINETDWWKKNKHRVLAGARLKIGLTQKQLAETVGIRQTVLSEYENGKRRITPKMAEKFAKALNTYPEKFLMK